MTAALGTSQWWEGRGLLGVGHLRCLSHFPWEENVELRILVETGFPISFHHSVVGPFQNLLDNQGLLL